MTITPLFSVIIPTYNRAYIVSRSIKSVLSQTLYDLELIVVDDGSTDHTGEIVKQIDDPRLRYVYQKNQGRSNARNTGVKAALGKYVTFLDSDDEALPDWLQQLSTTFLAKDVGIACCGIKIINVDEPGNEEIVRPHNLGAVFDGQKGLFLAGTFAVQREIFKAVGGFVQEAAPRENTELALRLIPYCLQKRYHITSIDTAHILYHKQPMVDQVQTRKQAQTLLNATKYTLQHHLPRLKKTSQAYANYCAIAGVNAALLDQYGEARHFFLNAIYTQPINWRHYGRLFLSLVPPLGRKYW
ncbi:MAG: glycosyltransferase family 2 protein [Caldilinea sp. CFX5]|nr:glycosyltransferase family 2 protein [Caldilinea sp. CFX5]